MNSRDIAALTGKEHKHVLADIRNMLAMIGLTSAEFSANLPDAYGRLQAAYALPKDLTLTLVSGYSVPMRHKIVSRWLELEASTGATSIKAPSNLREALILALEQEERIEALKTESLALTRTVAAQALKVAVYDAVVADSRMTVTAFARLLAGVNTQAVMGDLVRYGFLFDAKGGRRVYAKHRGTLFEEGIDAFGSRRVYILPKGKEKLVAMYRDNRLTMRKGHFVARPLAA